jgi:ribosomal protein S18 acetylase RimI-like enzyme
MPDPPAPRPLIRRIRPQDVEAWRAVRLRALLDAPDAFGSTYDETAKRPAEEWASSAARKTAGPAETLLLAFRGGSTVGLAGGFTAEEHADERVLISMWVDPALRGSGLARRLVHRICDWSTAAGATAVRLWVTETNERARRLYEACGFTPTGEREPLPSNPRLDEIEMRLDLGARAVVRRIQHDEAAVWRATRLAALQDAPDAFGPTYEESARLAPSYWGDRLARAASGEELAVFAAVDRRGRWIGLAGGGSSGDAGGEMAATRHLGSVWVAPEARGQQLVPRLLDAVCDWATAAGATRVALDVTETNARAIAIYERYGFRLTGARHPLRAGSALDEVEMALALEPAPTS